MMIKKTRFQERYGRIFNLSEVVMLPFCLPMVVSDSEGRGSVSLYLGPSAVVKGGFLTYVVQSGRVQQKYSFVPRQKLPSIGDLDVAAIAGRLYGDVKPTAARGIMEMVGCDLDMEASDEVDDEGSREFGTKRFNTCSWAYTHMSDISLST
jgi:hypothetical protein